MHYLIYVVVSGQTEPTQRDVESAVSGLLDKYRESDEQDYDSGRPYWDWWVIGGRWDGVIKNIERPRDWAHMISPEATLIENNMVRGRDVSTRLPKAIITAEGWLGLGDDDDLWANLMQMFLVKYQDDWVVSCDIHS